MRILFDQGAPLPLRTYLDRHEVRTAFQQGWATLKNGELLKVAEAAAGFQILLTTDKNLRYQQKLEERQISVVVPGRQQRPELLAHVHLIVEAIDAVASGSYVEIEIP